MENLVMVVTHKKCDIVQAAPYHPVIVGKGDFALANAWRDNTGDNISEKNPCYCELTALYWVWKNQAEHFENLGLCHYRRYLTKNAFSNKESDLLTDEDINRCMEKYDVILPKPFVWRVSVAQMYHEVGEGRKRDLDLTGEAIEKLYPEYREEFERVINGRQGSYCNIFVLPQELFNEYCQWLFSILGYVEERIDMTGYSVQEQRVYGYLSEILLNVWVRHRQLRVKYYPIAYMELDGRAHAIHAWKELGTGLRTRAANILKK